MAKKKTKKLNWPRIAAWGALNVVVIGGTTTGIVYGAIHNKSSSSPSKHTMTDKEFNDKVLNGNYLQSTKTVSELKTYIDSVTGTGIYTGTIDRFGITLPSNHFVSFTIRNIKPISNADYSGFKIRGQAIGFDNPSFTWYLYGKESTTYNFFNDLKLYKPYQYTRSSKNTESLKRDISTSQTAQPVTAEQLGLPSYSLNDGVTASYKLLDPFNPSSWISGKLNIEVTLTKGNESIKQLMELLPSDSPVS